MDKNKKISIVREVAKAYYNRGAYIQYDQRSMDRILQLTPRPKKFLPPEAATSQNTVFLDCSSFVNAIYYQVFETELPADLTWHMIDHVKPRVFYYELTHKETAEDISAMEKKIRALIEAGDVITYDRGVGSGHTLMYMGDNKFIHCTPNGRPESYDYVNKKSREYEDGGIFIDDISVLFEPDDGEREKRRSLFCRNNRRFAIARPLDIISEPTKNSIARESIAKDLLCEVRTSRNGGCHATYGEKVIYDVCVKNIGADIKDVDIVFQKKLNIKTLEPNQTICVSFELTVEKTSAIWMATPEITVNGMEIYVPGILIGNSIDDIKLQKVISKTSNEIDNNVSAVKAASNAYGQYGISMSSNEQEIIFNCFYLHDSTGGDVLSRKYLNSKKDIGVPSLFGGYGVVTPEAAVIDRIRCTKIRKEDLMAGDIILVSDDPYGNNTYSLFYTGDKLMGCIEYDSSTNTLENSEIDMFIDSLFGRFCFVILRPYM